MDRINDQVAVLSRMTDTEAAEHWGVTRQWAHALRKRLGIPSPPTAAQRVRLQVEALANRGLTNAEIARALGVPARRVAKLRPPGGPQLAPCGTRSAYNRHLRRGEPIDEACRQANNQSAIRRYQARKESE